MLIEADADELDQYLARKADEGKKSFLSDGDQVGDWRATGLLGRGGSGEVYRVVHAETGQVAAAKVLVRDGQSAANRFREEVAFLVANKLPQFPRFYSEGRIKGRPCLVIELLEPIDIPSSEKSPPPADALLWYNTTDDVQRISRGGGDVVPRGGLGGEA